MEERVRRTDRVVDKDGMCKKHSIKLSLCSECLEEYMVASGIDWFDTQEIIRDAYRGRIEARNKYLSICGDPIEQERFH
jgi:hypothetical protein